MHIGHRSSRNARDFARAQGPDSSLESRTPRLVPSLTLCLLSMMVFRSQVTRCLLGVIIVPALRKIMAAMVEGAPEPWILSDSRVGRVVISLLSGVLVSSVFGA